MSDQPSNVQQLQARLKATENEYEALRKTRNTKGDLWDDIGARAGAIRSELYALTGDHYGRPKTKKIRPADDLLNADYASPDEVPPALMVWVKANMNIITSDASDAVRWARISDTLHDDRYPEGVITIFRAAAHGHDAIREGDWVTTERKYAEMHLARYLGGKGRILEELIDGLDLLQSPTGNCEEAIWAPRELSGPHQGPESDTQASSPADS